MDSLLGLDVSASALVANKKRMSAISSNIANAQTTRTVEGGPYRKKVAVFGAEPARESFHDVLAGEIGEKVQKVHVMDVVSVDDPPMLKYEPNHPDANEAGYVAYPNINLTEETANMIAASRNYEANITSFNTTKNMALKALEIGR